MIGRRAARPFSMGGLVAGHRCRDLSSAHRFAPAATGDALAALAVRSQVGVLLVEGVAGEMFASYDSTSGRTSLYLDVDGDAVADMTIDFAGQTLLTGSDFIF